MTVALAHDRNTMGVFEIAIFRPNATLMPRKHSPLWERIVDAFCALFGLLSHLTSGIEWAVDRIVMVPFRAISELNIWNRQSFRRIIFAPFHMLSEFGIQIAWGLEKILRSPVYAFWRLGQWIGWAWERSLLPCIRILTELSGWIGWALVQTLLAPSIAMSKIHHWLEEALDSDPVESHGPRPLWHQAILLPFQLARGTVNLVWRILTFPFRRWTDET